MKYLKINGHDFCNMMRNASNRLEEKKEYVNSLNVFPVPDGDTGINMSMTFKSAAIEIEGMDEKGVGEISKVLARGALMGARGNSGVILSQIFRGLSKGLEGKSEATVEDMIVSFVEASNFAYKAVMRPTEGTILTIIKAASEAAVNSDSEDIIGLLEDVCKNAKIMLDKTPDMLIQLKQAKVVDAGGMGLLILLEGMLEVLKNNLKVTLYGNNEVKEEKLISRADKNYLEDVDIKFGYCTQFIVYSSNVDIPKFKAELEKRGDSIVLVGLDDIVKVHVHTNDPGEILSLALKEGTLSQIKIENMREQHTALGKDFFEGATSNEVISEISNEETAAVKEPAKKYGFVAVSRGEGINNILKDLGVDVVVEGGQTMNPSTQDIVEAVNKVNAETVFVLPNNKNIIMAANQAVDIIEEKKVVVIPSKTIPQGITSITMFNGESTAEDNEKTMTESLATVLSGRITYAVKDAEDDGRIIKENDILGLLEEKINCIGKDKFEVCKELIDNMVNEDSELITIFYGKDCDEDEVNSMAEAIEEKYPDLDVQVFDGKQPLDYFITSVE